MSIAAQQQGAPFAATEAARMPRGRRPAPRGTPPGPPAVPDEPRYPAPGC